MSNETIIELVGACSIVFGLAAFVGLVAIPAVTACSRLWERIAAAFLSLYVLAAAIGIGVVAGLGLVHVWPNLF